MVNPLVPATSSLPASPLPIEIERPALPDAAVKVTAAAQTQNTGMTSADQKSQGGPGQDAESPLDRALEELNGTLEAWSTGMRFDIDQDAQRVVVSIVDNATGEVLRTVPSDAVIKIAKMIVQLQGKGISTTA